MNKILEASLVKHFNVRSIKLDSVIQELWSGYGKLCRYLLDGDINRSIIVKAIDLSEHERHPRGWNTNASHLRKLRSYKVESLWYKEWAVLCNEDCRLPLHLYQLETEQEIILAIEDLDASGFFRRIERAELSEAKTVLKWLANFHATFLNESADNLWKEGSYWHLNTRQDEWQAMEDGSLKENAKPIAAKLAKARFQTIIHGDAKLANFCFNEDLDKVAAVDFQYVGGGCGMKDVAYFFSSCMDSEELYKNGALLLDFYFSALEVAIQKHSKTIDSKALKNEWKSLYPFAWADFVRFLEGWSPNHWKLHAYSKKMVEKALDELS